MNFWNNCQAMVALYVAPVRAMGRILDEGAWWFAFTLVLVLGWVLHDPPATRLMLPPGQYQMLPDADAPGDEPQRPPAQTIMAAQTILAAQQGAAGMVTPAQQLTPRLRLERRPVQSAPVESVPVRGWTVRSFYTPLLAILMLLTPVALLSAILLDQRPRVGYLFSSDYLPVAICLSFSFVACYLPVWLVGVLSGGRLAEMPLTQMGLWSVAAGAFFAYTVVVLRVALGMGWGRAAAAALIGFAATELALPLTGLLGPALLLFASPFGLFYLIWLLRSADVGALSAGMRQRQNFRRAMEAAAINPHDADAQIQLGLIHLARRQYDQARERLERAAQIDPQDAEAQFYLGRIAREQARPEDALRHFERVLNLNEPQNGYESWREIAAIHLDANMVNYAYEELTRYLAQRPYDPEGLYWMGVAQQRRGMADEARRMWNEAIDSARTMPRHRQAEVRRWRRAAEEGLRKL